MAGEPGVGLTIRVSNPLAPSGAGLPGAGLGLIGIRERAGMLGGQVNAGVYQGRFVVAGWVPWPAATGSEGLTMDSVSFTHLVVYRRQHGW